MSALTNAELTQQLQTLQSGMRVIEVTLETIVPKMDASIQESKSLAEDIKSQLTTHVDPIIKADVIGSLKKLDQNHQLLAQALEKKIQDVQTAMDKMNDEVKNAKIVSEQTTTQVLNQARKVEALEPQINAVAQEVAAEKHANQIKYTSTQSQIATMHASNTGPSTGPGKKLHEPLVCHKLMLGKNSLSGEEEYDHFDEWYTDMADDFELLIPGSKKIMLEAEKQNTTITMDGILSHADAATALTTSRELFSVLKKKTTGQARNQLKALNENEGLEAWRLIRANLCRKDGQRLQGEFDTLTTLQPIKLANFRDFPTLHKRWESELVKFAAIDPEYKLGKFQKRNIIYRALPGEIKEDVDREQAHNQDLAGYDDLVKFIINISRSAKYQKTSQPKPLTANLVDDRGEESQGQASTHKGDNHGATFSVEEWTTFLRQDEGQKFIAEGNPLPQEAVLALNAVVKGGWNSSKGKGNWSGGKGYGKDPRSPGKGKGKGKDGGKDGGKGKGMGKAHIQCHGCGEFGHFVRDCPAKSVKAIEESDWYQPYANSNRVTLCVTEAPFVGYGQHMGKSNCVHNIYPNHSISKLPLQSDGWTKVGSDFHRPMSVKSDRDRVQHDGNRWNNLIDTKDEADQLIETNAFPTINQALCTVENPKLSMPKLIKTSQKSKKCKRKSIKNNVRFTCDADNINMSKVDKQFSVHGQKSTAQSVDLVECDEELTCGVCKESNQNVVSQTDTEKSSKHIDWTSVVDQIKHAELMKSNNYGTTHIREYLHAMSKPAYHHTSYHIAPPNGINLLVSASEPGAVMTVEKEYVWAQIPCAVDSGACAHVSPPDIFGKLKHPEAIAKGKYFAADGSPIDEFGQLSINAVLEGGTELATTFDIVKITRPLLSVNQMVANGHHVVFGRDSSYIQVGGSKKRIHLRPEGKLYMLDMWVKLPIEVARNSPFVRQVSQA